MTDPVCLTTFSKTSFQIKTFVWTLWSLIRNFEMKEKRKAYNRFQLHDILGFTFQFVAHPNVQQLLASIWYEGLPGFRQMNMILQFLEVCRIGLLFPFFSLAYIICPWASFSQKLRKPFIKFICTSASYFTFLCKYNLW